MFMCISLRLINAISITWSKGHAVLCTASLSYIVKRKLWAGQLSSGALYILYINMHAPALGIMSRLTTCQGDSFWCLPESIRG